MFYLEPANDFVNKMRVRFIFKTSRKIQLHFVSTATTDYISITFNRILNIASACNIHIAVSTYDFKFCQCNCDNLVK